MERKGAPLFAQKQEYELCMYRPLARDEAFALEIFAVL